VPLKLGGGMFSYRWYWIY